MAWCWVFVKIFLVTSFVSMFFLVGVLSQVLFFFSPFLRKFVAQRNTQWTAILIKMVMRYKGVYRLKSQAQGALLICNHISYMDIPVIASKVPCLFVTSLDMKKTPFLGWITHLGGCLYVNRRSPKNVNKELQDIYYWIKQGFNVLLFPEATTSDGVNIKKFRSSLLQVEDDTSTPIMSYVLKYTQINNHKASQEDKRGSIAWVEGVSFLPHLIQQFKLRSVTFELTELGQTSGRQFKDRKSLAEHLETEISEAFYSSS